MEELVFESPARAEVPVKIGDRSYILREADEGAATEWRLYNMRHTHLANGKVVGVSNADAEVLLVSLCLFEKEADGKERRVIVPQIKQWPPRIVRVLFQKAKEISQLSEEKPEDIKKQIEALQKKLEKETKKDEDAKNSPSATTDGSV